MLRTERWETAVEARANLPSKAGVHEERDTREFFTAIDYQGSPSLPFATFPHIRFYLRAYRSFVSFIDSDKASFYLENLSTARWVRDQPDRRIASNRRGDDFVDEDNDENDGESTANENKSVHQP